MWPFRRRPDLLEQQRRELERVRRAESERGRGGGAEPPRTPPWTPIGGCDGANWHGTGFRFSVRPSGDDPGPPIPDPFEADMFPPGMTVHEFSGTPGELAAQAGKALLRSLLGRPRKR
jgi:hypothetical protein